MIRTPNEALESHPFVQTTACVYTSPYDNTLSEFAQCACDLANASSPLSHLLESGTGHATWEVAVSSFHFDVVRESYAVTADAYNPPRPPRTIAPLLGVIGMVLGSIFVAFALGELDWAFFDLVYVPGRKEERAREAALKEKAKREAEIKRASKGKAHNRHHHAKKKAVRNGSDPGVKYPAHNGLPDELCAERWYERMKRVFIRRYLYGTVLSLRRGDEYDLLLSTRWLQLASRLVAICFGVTVAAYMFFADDGTCETFRNQEDCERYYSLPLLRDTSAPTQDGLKQCTWILQREYCMFATPPLDTLSIVVVALCGALANVLSSATEYGTRRLDEYLRVWFKFRVVDYENHKLEAKAWAKEVVLAHAKGQQESIAMLIDLEKKRAYKAGEEFDEDFNPLNVPVPWGPGGAGTEAVILLEARKAKARAEEAERQRLAVIARNQARARRRERQAALRVNLPDPYPDEGDFDETAPISDDEEELPDPTTMTAEEDGDQESQKRDSRANMLTITDVDDDEAETEAESAWLKSGNKKESIADTGSIDTSTHDIEEGGGGGADLASPSLASDSISMLTGPVLPGGDDAEHENTEGDMAVETVGDEEEKDAEKEEKKEKKKAKKRKSSGGPSKKRKKKKDKNAGPNYAGMPGDGDDDDDDDDEALDANAVVALDGTQVTFDEVPKLESWSSPYLHACFI